MRKCNRFTILIVLALLCVVHVVKVRAETPISSSLESRLYLFFQAQESELQNLLPESWKVNPVPAGPAKDANLSVIFVQTLFSETPDGKPAVAAGMTKYLVIVVPAKNTQTGEEFSFVKYVYSTDPDSNSEHVKKALKADIRREFSQKVENMEAGGGNEFWEVKDANGGLTKVQFAYKRSAMNRAKRDHKVRFASDPGEVFLYRVDQTTELLKSLPTGVDQIQNYQFSTTSSEFSKLLNDHAKLVSVIEIPCFSLQVAKP